MKSSNKIPLSEVTARLAKATGFDFRTNHLAVLIHCWTKKHPDQAPGVSTLAMRKRKDGYAWLRQSEIVDLGRYAGYDISKNR